MHKKCGKLYEQFAVFFWFFCCVRIANNRGIL